MKGTISTGPALRNLQDSHHFMMSVANATLAHLSPSTSDKAESPNIIDQSLFYCREDSCFCVPTLYLS